MNELLPLESFLDPNTRFSINERDVIAESVDGEVIIINLNSGAYYSSLGSGDAIWQRLAAGLSVGEVLESLSSGYGVPSQAMEPEVARFLERLQAEELLAPDTTRSAAEASFDPPAAPYIAPDLQKYTDFEDLLKLDPIHEVHEAAGWPVQKQDA